MARSGEAIDSPVTRTRIVFRETAAETGGELLRFDFHLEPGSTARGEHAHPGQEERITVVSGTMAGRLDGHERTLREGDSVAVPPGTLHEWWNPDSEPAQLSVEYRPALRAEVVFENVYGLARDGKTNGEGMPKLLQRSVMLAEFRGEIGGHVPPPIRWVITHVVAPVARLLGYRPSYEKYVQ
jgi:quercetin dioxygenase-like cupin family protein